MPGLLKASGHTDGTYMDTNSVQGLVESVTGSGKPQQGAVVAKQLQPTMATSNPALSTTNLLHELDAAAQEVIGRVAAAQVQTQRRLQCY